MYRGGRWAVIAGVTVALALALASEASAQVRPGERLIERPQLQLLPPKLPAVTRLPAELQELEAMERRAARDPVRRITREHLVRARTDLERRGVLRQQPQRGPLPAAGRTPAAAQGLVETEGRLRVPREPPQPDRDRLMGTLRELHGSALLDEAGRRGLPARVGSDPDFSLVLSPDNAHSNDPYGLLRFFGGTSGALGGRVTLSHGSYYILGIRHVREHPYAWLVVDVPRDGWYVVSFRGYQDRGGRAAILHATQTPIASFDYESRDRTWVDYPVLVELAEGRHHFRLFVQSGTVAISQASIMSH